jgi:hypothetical protein
MEEKELVCYIYPNMFHFEKSCAYYMLEKKKIKFTTDIREPHDFGFFWDPGLKFKKNTGKMINYVKNKEHLINQRIKGTSKEFIGKQFNEIFGYDLRVNPTTYEGTGIVKKNGNGLKYGEILQLPISQHQVRHNHSYQKLITTNYPNNQNIFRELRVPIFGNIIPFVFFKKRYEEKRFDSKNILVRIYPTLEIFSQEEADQIIYFCKSIHLEYGELDIFRANEDGKIYIVDVNNTPWWPCNKLGGIDKDVALNLYWNAFLEYFFPHWYEKHHVADEDIDDYNKRKRKTNVIPYNQYKYISGVNINNEYSILDIPRKQMQKKVKHNENVSKKIIVNRIKVTENVRSLLKKIEDKNNNLKKNSKNNNNLKKNSKNNYKIQ